MLQVAYTTLSSFLATRRTVVVQPGNDGNHAEKRCTKLKAYSNLMKCGSWKKNLSEDVQSALETLIPGYVSFSQFFKDYVVDR